MKKQQPSIAGLKKKAKQKPLNYSLFYAALKSFGIPKPVSEYKFHKKRKWRFDLCWPDHKLAFEIEGGVWTGGRHTRASGFVKDMEKYNQAACHGFYLLRTVPSDIESGEAALLVKQFFEGRNDK
jgi:hypothetical protein